MKGFFVITVVAIYLALTAILHIQRPLAQPIDQQTSTAKWIAPAGPGSRNAYFQTCLILNDDPHNVRAWARIEALRGFILYVNHSSVSSNVYWRPTRPAQSGLSASGQKRREGGQYAITLNFPRDYQWGDDIGIQDAVLADLTPYLRKGENRISVQVEARAAEAAVRLEGGVTVSNGQQIIQNINISTGIAHWQAEQLPRNGNLDDWLAGNNTKCTTDLHAVSHRILDFGATWPKFINETTNTTAQILSPPPADIGLSIANKEAFSRPFRSTWLQSPTKGMVWFKAKFNVKEPTASPWLRILADRPYDLFINGNLVKLRPLLTQGEWILGTSSANFIPTIPVALETNEIRSIFALERENPMDATRPPPLLLRDNDNYSEVEAIKFNWLEERVPRFPWSRILNDNLKRPWSLLSPTIQNIKPDFSFVAYDLRGLLRPGTNHIILRLAPVTRKEMTGIPGLAVDGNFEADTSNINLEIPSAWSVQDAKGKTLTAIAVANSLQEEGFPALKWVPRWNRGPKDFTVAEPDTESSFTDPVQNHPDLAFTVVLIWISALLLLRLRYNQTWNTSASELAVWTAPVLFLATGIVMLSGVVAESQEAWYFNLPHIWWIVFYLSISAIPVAALLAMGASLISPIIQPRRWSATNSWTVLVVMVIIISFLIRVWRADFQPIDDDEYASVQAILSIVKTGVPSMASPNIIYTRGPFYHYLTAPFVWLFGKDLDVSPLSSETVWALRLPSAFFSVATALLIYQMGVKLLRNRWVAIVAMILFALHPFSIFTGHVARFYQQHQFFATLAIYWFIVGYVRNGSTRIRVFTVFAWLAAVLTQELSIVMIVQFGAGLILFRGQRPWREDIPVFVAGFVSAILIGLNILAFQILCLTSTEGVSPVVQAGLGLNLKQPFNMAAIFLGYARIHTLGSLFLIPSFIRSLRKQCRSCLGLYFILFSGVVLSNITITHVSLRYQYWLFPVWYLLVAHGAAVITLGIIRWLQAPPTASRRALVLTRMVVLLILLAPWGPWRLPGSYSIKILGDVTGAMHFIRANLREQDRVFVSEPHSHAAFLETGRVDGYISVPLLYDFNYLHHGKMLDRNGNAPVITNLNQLQREFQKHGGRIWIALNREKSRNRVKNLAWEYPGARIELFLRENCVLKYETYLWSVYLWDPQRGYWHGFGGASRR